MTIPEEERYVLELLDTGEPYGSGLVSVHKSREGAKQLAKELLHGQELAWVDTDERSAAQADGPEVLITKMKVLS